MDTAATCSRTLEIDGMHGDACVQKVTGALKAVDNVTTQSVKVGSATIGADQAGCTAACAAIGTAGYKAREGEKKNNAGATSHAAPEAKTYDKTGGQQPNQAQNQGNSSQNYTNAGKGNDADKPGNANTGGMKTPERAPQTAPVKPVIATH